MSISRWTGDDGKGNRDGIIIDVKDDSSGVLFLKVKMDPATFARLVTGQSEMVVDFELQHADKIGMAHENKIVLVLVPKDKYAGREAEAKMIRTAVAVHEVDGWRGRDDDIRNMHKYVGRDPATGDHIYRVAYGRFVARDGDVLHLPEGL